MQTSDRIYIAGHKGMVGSAIHRLLISEGYENLVYASSGELDLRDQDSVTRWFQKEQPQYVFLCAARVGGILANRDHPGTFLYDNLMIQTNVIHAAYKSKVKKLLFLGSSCIYPKYAEQPISEESLLQGPLEHTNRAYAIAKIAGIELCQSYSRQHGWNAISVMPCNLYGPNDNYDPQTSHVLPALIKKFYEAHIHQKDSVTIWGTGTPLREFLHVDDLADASLFLMKEYNDLNIINVGTGEEVSIKDLAVLIKDLIGYEGDIIHDMSKPDGTPRKVMNNQKIKKAGWYPKISLKTGVKMTIDQYIEAEKATS